MAADRNFEIGIVEVTVLGGEVGKHPYIFGGIVRAGSAFTVVIGVGSNNENGDVGSRKWCQQGDEVGAGFRQFEGAAVI